MKRVFFSFFLIFALSCGRTVEERLHAVVFKFDGSQVEGDLAYVGDSSLRIRKLNARRDSLIEQQDIPIDSIDYVRASYVEDASGPILGGLIGGIVGCGIGAQIAYNTHSSDGEGGGISFPPQALAGCALGAGTGAIGGCYATHLKTKYYPSDKSDRHKLRQLIDIPE